MKTLSSDNLVNIVLLVSGTMAIVGLFAQIKGMYALGIILFVIALIAKAIRD